MSTLAFCLEPFPLVEFHSSKEEYADTAPGVSWQRDQQVLTTPAILLPSHLAFASAFGLALADISIMENIPEKRT